MAFLRIPQFCQGGFRSSSGVFSFPDSGFSNSTASGAGVLAGLGAVFSGCHRDGGGGRLGGAQICYVSIFAHGIDYVTYCCVWDAECLCNGAVTLSFFVQLQNRSVPLLLQLYREGWGRPRGWDFCLKGISPKAASGRPRVSRSGYCNFAPRPFLQYGFRPSSGTAKCRWDISRSSSGPLPVFGAVPFSGT